MMRAGLCRSLGVLMLSCLALGSCREAEFADLPAGDAAAALRASQTFTTRPASPVRRELIEIVAVRRIGRSSTEVEFTWRDAPLPPGQPVATVRTSMALFRVREDGNWGLASLYKVD